MNLQKKNLRIIFFTCFFLTIWIPVILPQIRLYFFAPYLIVLLYKRPLINCLWGALGCGLLIDALSAYQHLGLHALNYTLTLALLYRQRRHFFADSPSTLPIMTYLFSAVSTAIQIPLLYVFEQKLRINSHWIRTDLLLMPLFDAVYAFCVFILPFWVFGKPRLKGKDYFTDH